VRRFSKACGDQLPREVDRLEHLWIGPEQGPRAAASVPARIETAIRLLRTTALPNRDPRISPRVVLHPTLPVTEHLDAHLRREGVDVTVAHAVHSARNLVALASVLPALMVHGVLDLASSRARCVA